MTFPPKVFLNIPSCILDFRDGERIALYPDLFFHQIFFTQTDKIISRKKRKQKNKGLDDERPQRIARRVRNRVDPYKIKDTDKGE